MSIQLLSVAVVSAAMTMFGCSSVGPDEDQPVSPAAVPTTVAPGEVPSYAPSVLREPVPASTADQDKLISDAARAAWAMIDRNYQPATGLTNAQPDWAYPTAWDIASSLAAYYSARGLGYISDAEYKKRASRLLETMGKARMYQNIAYGRNYDAKTGELVGPDQKPHEHGTGWSAMDLGRLLVILGVVAKQDPELASAASAVATRIRTAQVMRNGYLYGTEINTKTGKPETYQEGRLGYEQYAAHGFALWNMRAGNALNARANAKGAKVLDIPITADRRGLDRLTSEPFIMQGLELGWDADMREMAWQTLSAQAARFMQTKQMTMASEDAIKKAPHYFYYYCVYCSGKPFVINVHTPGLNLDEPRWVSTKAAFAWFALIPSNYTWQAVKTVAPALSPKDGWASGVYEGTNKSTETYSVNTSALILEAALYRKTGKPLIAQSR